MIQLLQGLVPAIWRRKPAGPQLAEDKLVAALGAVEDAQPQWLATGTVLRGQLEINLAFAMNPNSTDDQKLRALERAGAVKDCLEVLETVRTDAKAMRERLEEQRREEEKRKPV